MPGSAGLAYYEWYQCVFGKILPHFYVNYIFLAQKLTKLHNFRENPSKNHQKISQNEKIQIRNVPWSWWPTFQQQKQGMFNDINKLHYYP